MKHLSYILFLALLFSGCSKKTEELFEESSDARVARHLAKFKKALMDSPGWKLFVYPQGLENQNIEVGGLTYYVSFPDSNRTVMVADFVSSMALVPRESSYRLKALQRPSLIFDTYSYIHVAADPDEIVSSSPTGMGGYGWGTDYEFSFKNEEPSDTILLEGNFNNSKALLIKVSQEEINEAFSGRLAYIVDATTAYSNDNAFLYFNSTSNQRIGVSLNLFLYRINFSYLDDGQFVTVSAPFSHTLEGLHLKNSITIGGYTFQDLIWDEATEVYYINTSSGRVNIINASEPLFPLAAVLGKSITTITIPTVALPGQSPVYADVYAEIKDSLKLSGYNLDLDRMSYIFDEESGSMALQVFVTRDGSTFLIQYVFAYVLNPSGIADFQLVNANPNGESVINDMLPLLLYLENDIFKLDYFIAGSEVLGQFISQDNPDFYFTGTLQ